MVVPSPNDLPARLPWGGPEEVMASTVDVSWSVH